MRQLHAADVEPLLHPEEAPVDECCERLRRGASGGEGFLDPLLRHALPVAGVRQQFVLDETAHAGGHVGEAAFVEFRKNRVA